MDNILERKAEIRKNIKNKRKSLSAEEVARKSNIICRKIICSDIYKKAKTIYCYNSIRNEVDLSFLINQALEDKKKVALPKVTDKKGEMIFVELNNMNRLKPGEFGILEPVGSQCAAKPDFIIVPGVAFSANGDRIGQAGGFYDRFLRKNPTFSVGVAYDFQMLEELPTESHDIKIDRIITEKEVYY